MLPEIVFQKQLVGGTLVTVEGILLRHVCRSLPLIMTLPTVFQVQLDQFFEQLLAGLWLPCFPEITYRFEELADLRTCTTFPGLLKAIAQAVQLLQGLAGGMFVRIHGDRSPRERRKEAPLS